MEFAGQDSLPCGARWSGCTIWSDFGTRLSRATVVRFAVPRPRRSDTALKAAHHRTIATTCSALMAWRGACPRRYAQLTPTHRRIPIIFPACSRRASSLTPRKPCRSTKLYSELPVAASDAQTGLQLPPLEPFVAQKRKRRGKTLVSEETPSPPESSDGVGSISPRLLELGPEGQEWPPLAKDVLTNLARFPGCILLTRVGGFYESYFDQAPLLAGMLSIKLANRSWGGRSVAMAGFPLSQLEKYLKVLVQDHRKLVAICEEFRSDDNGRVLELNEKADIVRRVTRIVSPGTLIDERWLDPLRNNFVLSVAKSDQSYGLAWLDLSTSDLHVSFCDDDASLRDEINRISPSEVVLPFDSDVNVHEIIDVQKTLLSYLPATPEPLAFSGLESEATQTYSHAERSAMANLTSHLRSRLLEISADAVMPTALARHHLPQDFMAIDANTLDALEVRETNREGGVRGSLVSTVRRTLTKGGSRLLVDWLTSPSTSIEIITHRHAAVAYLVDSPFLREDWRSLFRIIQRGDISRTLQRISTARNDEQDLLEVRDFIHFTLQLKESAASLGGNDETGPNGLTGLASMIDDLASLEELHEELGNAIDESVMEKRMRTLEALDRDAAGEGGGTTSSSPLPKATSKKDKNDQNGEDPWGPPFEHLIRPSSSKVLSRLTREYQRLRKEASNLQISLRDRLASNKVTLRFLLGQGFVVHFAGVTKTMDEPAGLTVATKTKSTRTFYHEPWSQIGSRLLRLQEELKRTESAELRRLRRRVVEHSSALRRNAQIVDELDCLLGFAQLAVDMRLVRPDMLDSSDGSSIVFDVESGRHIGVEGGLLERGRHFTPNDLQMDMNSRLHFITGPNMGGKSTFLRQNALICILAQAGSFVPADSARLSVVDRLFSRVGAKDDLFRDRSTFMVEMLETAEILRRATNRSFVVADEIGRGTTTQVGVSIAFATLKTLGDIGCRAIFATHLHELADLMGYDETSQVALDEHFQHVRFASTDVEETADTVTYLHHIRPGINRESHGLAVAALAGMPPQALEIARSTMRRLNKVAE
ncbi:unnamed protein product [Parajaminaea phylloscopi]